MNYKNNTGVHWSFWIIVAIALIWNAMGVINFFMQTNVEMIATIPEEYRSIIEGRATWLTVAFAIAVFGGTLGCLLLLFKRSAAFYLFIASLIGGSLQIIPSMEIGTVQSSIGFISFILVAMFLIWYSKQASGKGWIS